MTPPTFFSVLRSNHDDFSVFPVQVERSGLTGSTPFNSRFQGTTIVGVYYAKEIST